MHKKHIPFHPFLIAAFPVLFLFSHNIGALTLNVIIAPMAISVVSAAALFFLINAFLKDSAKTALIASLFLMLFFSYGHAYQAIGATGITAKAEPALFVLWAAFFAVGAYLITKTRKDLAVLTYLCNSMAAMLVLLSLANICYYELARLGAGQMAKEAGSGTATGYKGPRPNIYYIVVDAYAGEDVLKDVYGYDNSAFIHYLREKGFYVAGASTSNYARTGLSLASTLNMDYLDTLMGRLDAGSQDVSLANDLTRNGKVFDLLRRRGYTIAALASGCVESEISTADIYIRPGWTPDEFQNMLIGTTPIPLVLGFFGSPDQYDIHTDRILFEFEKLADTGKLKEPFFMFAQIAAPHPPFVFGPDGERRKPGLIFTNEDGDSLIRRGRLTKNQYVLGYTGQLTFINRKLEKVLDSILSGSGNRPVIILQSDHGARSGLLWEDPERTDMKECMSILNAYYLPRGGEALLYKNITPVNTFRVIFNYYFGTDYRLLEDRSFFSTAKHPYKFIDVTDAVRKP